jgi:hypothetical protein
MAGASDHGKGGAVVGILYNDFRKFRHAVSENFTTGSSCAERDHGLVLKLQRESASPSAGTEFA